MRAIQHRSGSVSDDRSSGRHPLPWKLMELMGQDLASYPTINMFFLITPIITPSSNDHCNPNTCLFLNIISPCFAKVDPLGFQSSTSKHISSKRHFAAGGSRPQPDEPALFFRDDAPLRLPDLRRPEKRAFEVLASRMGLATKYR